MDIVIIHVAPYIVDYEAMSWQRLFLVRGCYNQPLLRGLRMQTCKMQSGDCKNTSHKKRMTKPEINNGGPPCFCVFSTFTKPKVN